MGGWFNFPTKFLVCLLMGKEKLTCSLLQHHKKAFLTNWMEVTESEVTMSKSHLDSPSSGLPWSSSMSGLDTAPSVHQIFFSAASLSAPSCIHSTRASGKSLCLSFSSLSTWCCSSLSSGWHNLQDHCRWSSYKSHVILARQGNSWHTCSGGSCPWLLIYCCVFSCLLIRYIHWTIKVRLFCPFFFSLTPPLI